MAPNKCQSICFWRYAPRGPGADQAILTWENFLLKKMPVGEALIDAKWRGYQNWAPQTGRRSEQQGFRQLHRNRRPVDGPLRRSGAFAGGLGHLCPPGLLFSGSPPGCCCSTGCSGRPWLTWRRKHRRRAVNSVRLQTPNPKTGVASAAPGWESPTGTTPPSTGTARATAA